MINTVKWLNYSYKPCTESSLQVSYILNETRTITWKSKSKQRPLDRDYSLKERDGVEVYRLQIEKETREHKLFIDRLVCRYYNLLFFLNVMKDRSEKAPVPTLRSIIYFVFLFHI
jgi:hypothetical protein